MTEILVALIVGLTALAAGWLWGRQKGSGAEQRAAGAEARLSEVQARVSATETELQRTRESLVTVERERTEARTRLEESEKNLAEQKAILEEARTKLVEAFGALAGEALNKNNESFIALAETKFKQMQQAGTGELESRKQAVEELVKPLRETLAKYQTEAQRLEEARREQMGSVAQQLTSLATSQMALQQETSKLVNALRSPQVRGAWGEITLRKTAELAGMTAYCDFFEQESTNTETGRIRPDMIVRLPAGREVIVDAKVPLSAYLEALEASTDAAREIALKKHVDQIYAHIHKLASKEYWSQYGAAAEFVVLFIPNDSFLAAAAERDPELIEAALTKKVVIATSTTFIALLKAIAYGWKQQVLTENAKRICALGEEMSERIGVFTKHFTNVGKELLGAVEAYNSAVGSLETRVLVSARRFKELGAGDKEIPEVEPVSQQPRAIAAGE